VSAFWTFVILLLHNNSFPLLGRLRFTVEIRQFLKHTFDIALIVQSPNLPSLDTLYVFVRREYSGESLELSHDEHAAVR
jgi:hypothetical protein